jgi:hypothetical protein
MNTEAIMVPSWNVYKVNGSPAGFLTPSATGIDPKIENEVICDPIQGNVSDCFFLAALGSCAWNTTSLLPTIPIKPGNNFDTNFSIPFWWFDINQPMTTATAFVLKQTAVSNKLFLGANGMPVYAQPTPQNEIWVAIYEKAFAKFKDCTPDAEGNPDISQLPSKTGSALSALVNLTKKKFSFTTAPLPQTAFLTRDAPPSPYRGQICVDYFDVIYTVCSRTAISGKTQYPMVAWTYDSEDNTPIWKAKGLRYRSDTDQTRMLLPKHTYSILGYYKIPNGDKYIVLRDPKGSVPCGDAFISSYLTSPPPDTSYYWDPVGNAAKFKPIDLSKCSCGVFGLRVDAFTGCFSGFGWVQ